MNNNTLELQSLPDDSYEVQDNTFVDKWGISLKIGQLPVVLRESSGYSITINGKTYDLILNRFDSNIYSGQVSSIEHTKEDVLRGRITRV